MQSASAAEDSGLSDVVVSARRAPQPRSEYAGSIERIEGDELALLGAQHYATALNRAPGVMIQRGSGQEALIAIRSPVLSGAGACGGFLVLEDGLPTRPTGFCNVNELFELNTDQAAAIEVLRGAAPALYGANALHGVVNVITPAAQQLRGVSLALEDGMDDWRRLRIAAGNGALGLFGTTSHDGGWRVHSATDETKLNLLGDYALAGGELKLRAAATELDQQTAGFVRGFDSYRNLALSRGNDNPEAYRKAWSSRVGVYWSETGAGAPREINVLLRRSQMDFLQHFLLGKPLERNGQSSARLALSQRGERGALGWALGSDAEWANGTLLEIQSGPTLEGSAAARAIRPAGRHYDYDVRALTLALWASAEWHPAARWALGFDARLDRTSYRYDNHMRSGNTDENGVACGAGGCLYSRPADRSDRFGAFTPKVHLRYETRPGSSVYVVLARGFRPPEATELYRLQRQQNIASLRSEQLDSAELGWTLSTRATSASLAAFTMRKQHVILRDSNGFNISDGRTRHQGIEYSLGWRFMPRWQLALAGSEARHRYDFSLAVDGGETIVAGREIDTAPRHLQTLRLRYHDDDAVQAELEWVHVGAYFADAANLARYPGHRLVNLRAAWSPRPHWQLSARIDNLGNLRYADRADFAQGDYRYFPGRSRSVFLQLQWQNH